MMQGLSAIICLGALNGLLIGWNIADIAAGVRIAKVRDIGEANLTQAEQYFTACLHHAPFVIGDDVYACRARRSDIKAHQLKGLL